MDDFLVEDYHEEEEQSDEDNYDDKVHSNLLNDLHKISGRRKSAVRTVRASSNNVASIRTKDLLEKVTTRDIKRKSQKITALDKPLEKHAANRVRRSQAFEKLSMEVNKWESCIYNRRRASQVTFPLQEVNIGIHHSEKIAIREPKTALQKDVFEMLHGAKLVKVKKQTEEERNIEKAMSLEEVKERNRELWEARIIREKLERKASRKGAIKSKKFHRILRKEKLKKQKAEIEELAKTDIEAAQEKLKEIDEIRIRERMSLRHRKSKWAHLQGLRASHDKTAMSSLQENKRLHQELRAKNQQLDWDEGSDGQSGDEDEQEYESDGESPWSEKNRQRVTTEKKDTSFTKLNNFWNEIHDQKLKKLEKAKESENKIIKTKSEKLCSVVELDHDNGEDSIETKDGNKKNKKSKTKKITINNEDLNKKSPQTKVIKQKKRKLSETENNDVKTNKKSKLMDKNSKEDGTKDSKNKNTKAKKVTDDDTDSNKVVKKKRKIDIDVDEMFNEAEFKLRKKVENNLNYLDKTLENDDNEETNYQDDEENKKKKFDARYTEYSFNCDDTVEINYETHKRNPDESVEEKQSNLNNPNSVAEVNNNIDRKTNKANNNTDKKTREKKNALINPKKFISVKAKKLSKITKTSGNTTNEVLDDDSGDESDENDAEDYIHDALADDFLISDFNKDKKDAIKKGNPLIESTTALPGWGDWTGPGIKMSKKKAKRFRVKTPQIERKDSTIGQVIYNEESDVHPNLRKKMVNKLPMPYASVKDFEASVRAPIGRMYVPEHIHRKLTAPPVVTKLGVVIEPITVNELLDKKKKMKAIK